jgi:hypothetical protein
VADTTAPVTADDLRDRYATAAAEWALMYPLAKFLGLVDGDAVKALAMTWGEGLADAVLPARDDELERLRGELGQATADLEAANHFLAQQGPLLHRAEQAEAEVERAEAERRAHFETERNPLAAAYARFRQRHVPCADRCLCGRDLPCAELSAWESALATLDAPTGGED